jgi:hypothetical protein
VKPVSPTRFVVALSVAAAVVLVSAALVEGGAWYAAAFFIVVPGVAFRPRLAVPLLLGLLTIQDPLAMHVAALSKQAGGALKSLDELAIIAAALRLLILRRRG